MQSLLAQSREDSEGTFSDVISSGIEFKNSMLRVYLFWCRKAKLQERI
jgi:hypothetical protein